MKKLLLFIPVLLSMAILFAACGESRPDDLPVTRNASAEKTFPALIAPAGTPQNLTVTFRLEDFPGISEYKRWISKVEFIFTSSHIEFTGITADNVELKDVSFSLGSDSNKRLLIPGSITANEKFDIDSQERLNFMQAIMDEVKAKGSSNVVLKYTPTNNMVNEDTKVSIKLNARFSFN